MNSETGTDCNSTEKAWRHIDVAAPCTASWDAMTGDDKSRFCGQCQLNVYNLSAMSDAEVDKLWQSKNGRLCARFYQRADGTVLTDNCPVGLRKLRDAARRAVRVAATVLSLALSWTAAFAGPKCNDKDTNKCQKNQATTSKKPVRDAAIMGDVAEPAPAKRVPMMGSPVPIPPQQVKMGEMVAIPPEVRQARYLLDCSHAVTKQLAPLVANQADRQKINVQIEFNRTGKVVDAKITKSAGNKAEEAAVLKAAKAMSLPPIPADMSEKTLKFEFPLASSHDVPQ